MVEHEALLMRQEQEAPLWRWYHGLGFIAAAQAAALGLEALTTRLTGNPSQRDSYHQLKQAVFAPPAWVFGPAWITNTILMVAAGLRVLNQAPGTEGRAAFLRLQAASWAIFATFTAASAGLRSPINSFGLTAAMRALNIASMVVARRTLKDPAAAQLLVPLDLWLQLASAVALCQMLWNRDDLYQAGPFATPPAWLLRD